ncbi:MAG TPA: hypothetical protein PLO16_05595 [Acidocella sp.]|nr:hypothetical protein [Acidocella sp.]
MNETSLNEKAEPFVTPVTDALHGPIPQLCDVCNVGQLLVA